MRPALALVLVWTFCEIQAVPVEPRLTLADGWNSYYQTDTNGRGSYSFGYDLEDPQSGNIQYRVEEKYPNGTVAGSYGLLEPDGNVKVVKYVANEQGYRVTVDDSNQKHPRYYPPITSREEKIRDSEQGVRAPAFQGLKALNLRPFSQPIDELRTPPKYQNSMSRSPFESRIWQNVFDI